MFWKSVLGVCTTPMKTLEHVAEERPVLVAGEVVLAATLSWCLGAKLAYHYGAGKIAEFVSYHLVPAGVVFGTMYRLNVILVVVMGVLIAIVGWFVKTAVLQLSAEILGGKGRGFSLLATVGCAYAPMLLLLPVAGLAALLGGGNLESGVGAGIWYCCAMMLHVWTVYVILLGIRATHQMSLPDAVRVVAYPAVAVLVIAIVLKICVFVSGLGLHDLLDVKRWR